MRPYEGEVVLWVYIQQLVVGIQADCSGLMIQYHHERIKNALYAVFLKA